MKREYRGKGGIENNVNTALVKGPRKPLKKEMKEIRSNVNIMQ